MQLTAVFTNSWKFFQFLKLFYKHCIIKQRIRKQKKRLQGQYHISQMKSLGNASLTNNHVFSLTITEKNDKASFVKSSKLHKSRQKDNDSSAQNPQRIYRRAFSGSRLPERFQLHHLTLHFYRSWISGIGSALKLCSRDFN